MMLEAPAPAAHRVDRCQQPSGAALVELLVSREFGTAEPVFRGLKGNPAGSGDQAGFLVAGARFELTTFRL